MKFYMSFKSMKKETSHSNMSDECTILYQILTSNDEYDTDIERQVIDFILDSGLYDNNLRKMKPVFTIYDEEIAPSASKCKYTDTEEFCINTERYGTINVVLRSLIVEWR